MSTRGWELVAADEPAVMPEPLLDSVVVENGEGDRGFPDPTNADESNWTKILGEMDYLLDQFIPSEEGPWRRRWQFSGYAGFRCETTRSMGNLSR